MYQASIPQWNKVRVSGVKCFDVEIHPIDSPFVKAFQFIDPDDNQIELCVRRQPLAAKDGISHVIFETANLARATRFYTEGLGLKLVGEVRGETLFEFQNHQMVGVKAVKELSERTKKKGRACHVAFNVSQEDYDVMLERIPKLEGRSLGDFRATDGLRPAGERSIYFFDPTPIICKSPPSATKRLGDDLRRREMAENHREPPKAGPRHLELR